MIDIALALITFGIGMILATVFSFLFASTISFWIGGKLVKSLNDEFMSAVKTTVYLLILSLIVTALSGGIHWLNLQFGFDTVFTILDYLVSFVGLFSFFMIIKNVYDISYPRTFVLAIVSFVIEALLIVAIMVGSTTILGFNVMNKIKDYEVQNEITPTTEVNSGELMELNSPVSTTESNPTINSAEPVKRSGPKIPGQ